MKNFYSTLKQKVMACLQESLQETKPGYTTTNLKQREHSTSPKPKKFRTQPTPGKIMLIYFWDEQGVILEHYRHRGNTITSASYCNMLKNHLRPAIRSKRRALLTTGVILQHDNVRHRIARATIVPSMTFALSLFYIHHTNQTWPRVITTCLDHSKRRWEERNFSPMKRYTRRCLVAAHTTTEVC